MIEGRPSQTAFHVAAARAAHLRFDSTPPVLDDTLAETFLDEDQREMIEGFSNDGPWILLENRLFLPVRARFVEDRLKESYARGVRQLVVLGAGLDSFAWRQPDGLEDLRIFEVDHPATQNWKAARLKALGMDVPRNTQLVPCNFEESTASQALAATDFDPKIPAIVSWMGVIYYLERPTANAALADLSTTLAPDSEVIFDVMLPWEELAERYHAVRKAATEFLKDAGEPHINRYRPSEIEADIVSAGFADATTVQKNELVERYLAGRPPLPTRPETGGPVEISERFFLAVARR